MEYKPTIGLEIHAELKTRTKMFCDSLNDLDEKRPNTNVCPVCMGHPGTLPTINKKAVEEVIRVGLALGGRINPETKFDRKNYFYPDLPKGYQISQYDKPLVEGGELLGKRITRIHLEEDAGTIVHVQGGPSHGSGQPASLIDFNRAGAPLMELVTEPDFTSAEEVVAFARELQLILRYLGASDADMEKGLMRIEANVSIRPNENRMESNDKRIFDQDLSLLDKNSGGKRRIVLPDESYKLMGLLFEVHNKLGSVFNEKNYQDAIEAVFIRERIPYEREKKIELKLDDAVVSNFFADFIINKEILLEVKATKSISQSDIRQVLHYIKSADLPLGIVANFRRDKLEYKRLINPKFDDDSMTFDERSSEKLGTKVEIKNLNSFKAVGLAINYEIKRQAEILENGAKVSQETRGWDEDKQKTVSQRSKEEAHDYRYFPEPDLPPFETKIFDLEKLKDLLPELPAAKRARFAKEYGLNEKQVETLVGESKLAEFFEEAASEEQFIVHGSRFMALFNYLTSDLRGLMNEKNTSFGDLKIDPEHLAHLVVLIEKGKIGSRQAKDVLKKMFETGLDPEEIVQQDGLETVSDTAELEMVVKEVIEKNPKAVEDFKRGKAASLQFLMGQAMAKLKGRGDPQKLRSMIEDFLKSG